MLDRVEFMLSEAFTSLRRNTWMTFSAITTSATALLLLGGLGLIYMGILRFSEDLGSRLEMRVLVMADELGAYAEALEEADALLAKDPNNAEYGALRERIRKAVAAEDDPDTPEE